MDADRHGRIRQRAYELWQREGRPEGRAQENWLRAEAQIAEFESDAHRMSIKDSITLIRDLFVIIAILLFFAGWLFAYYLLNDFGISAYVSDIPIYAFYFYAINTIIYTVISGWHAIILVLILILAFSALCLALPRIYRATTSFIERYSAISFLGCIVIGFVLLFPLTWYAALEAATVIRERKNPDIQFHFKDGGDLAKANLSTTISSMNCLNISTTSLRNICKGNHERRLVLVKESSDYFVVLYKPVPPVGISAIPVAFVYRIPTSEVVLAITPQVSASQEKRDERAR